MNFESAVPNTLTGKKILVASLQGWNYLLLSKHYLTLELAKRDNQIVFLSIERIFKRAFKKSYINKTNFNGIVNPNINPIKIKVIAGFLKFKFIYLISKWLVKMQLRSIFCPDIILIFDPQFLMLCEFYPKTFKIYYCVDYIALGEELRIAEKKILENVDMVVTASDNLFEDYKKKHKNVYFVPHGVDILEQYELPELKKEISEWFGQFGDKVKLGYVGNISPEIDWDLINHIANENENRVIILVGPISPEVKESLAILAKNIKFFGHVPAIGVKYCMSYLDAGFIPYKDNEFNKRRNPIKILQYLSFGIPVVSTKVGMNFDSNLVYQTNNKYEFVKQLNRMITENSNALVKLRKNFALSNSWSSRVNELDEIICKNK